MEPIVSLICSDFSEKHVFAEAFQAGLKLTFCFSYDACRPTCLGSRVVASYNDYDDQPRPFPSRQSLRDTIWAAIGRIWTACVAHPSVRMLDVIVHLDDKGEESHQPTWTVHHDRRFQIYSQGLRRVQSLDEASVSAPRFVTWSDLEFTYALGGRSSTTLVNFDGKQYVYKGLTFRLFLELDENFRHEMAAFYNEIDVVSCLTKHPSLLAKPAIFVTIEPDAGRVSEYNKDTRYCGTLYPYFPTGDLQERIDTAGARERLELSKKAKWASQIASGLQAAHLAGQYHMDLKPSNVLLDNNECAVLIDWEQFGASRFFIAPEADGTWDVIDVAGSLEYRRHVGPLPEDSPTWPPRNVFPLWQQDHPRALESAEVYALGRTLWVLLEQIHSDAFEDVAQTMSWSTHSDDIPSAWKSSVAHCCDLDPLQRCSLADAVKFWESVDQ